jgi:hypothetical protein
MVFSSSEAASSYLGSQERLQESIVLPKMCAIEGKNGPRRSGALHKGNENGNSTAGAALCVHFDTTCCTQSWDGKNHVAFTSWNREMSTGEGSG